MLTVFVLFCFGLILAPLFIYSLDSFSGNKKK